METAESHSHAPRIQPRFSIQTPVTVSGVDADGHFFSESAEVVNGSAEGLAFMLDRDLQPFTVLVISMPRDGRPFEIESQVRHVTPSDRGRVVGVQFRKTTLI
ncbi:MAG: PilZ domain-containing protein [Acidobacteriota bacterium]